MWQLTSMEKKMGCYNIYRLWSHKIVNPKTLSHGYLSFSIINIYFHLCGEWFLDFFSPTLSWEKIPTLTPCENYIQKWPFFDFFLLPEYATCHSLICCFFSDPIMKFFSTFTFLCVSQTSNGSAPRVTEN